MPRKKAEEKSSAPSYENKKQQTMPLTAACGSSSMLGWHRFVLGIRQPKFYYRE